MRTVRRKRSLSRVSRRVRRCSCWSPCSPSGVADGALVRWRGAGAARSGAVADGSNGYSGGMMMAADPTGGYWTVTAAGAVTPHGGAPALGLAGPVRTASHPAHRRHGGDARRQRLLARGLRRGHLQLRRRGVLRLYGRHPPQPAHRRHGGHPAARVLARGLRRRHLQLRRRHLLRLDRGHPPQPAHRRHGADRRRQRILARRLRRRHLQLRRRRVLRVHRGHPPQPAHRRRGADARRAGYWLVASTAGSSPSATPGTTGRRRGPASAPRASSSTRPPRATPS